ncbi:hypothetical protein V1512DRAFT_202737 [Lipomyces arxii]|uniref:uncharacterized protein n=1 Tax=Lipomyces arxii TaxID=56418 RepID=UPI0034CDA0AE
MFFGRNKFDVEGRLVVISGASQGLGRALARLLFSKGADVVIVARREEPLKAAVKEIEKARVLEAQTISYVSADLSIASEATRVITTLDRVPDVLMCCAGASIPKLFTELTSEELLNGVSVNYMTALYLAHAGLKAMAATPSPTYPRHVVFFSSVVHFYSFIGYSQYAPSKSALRSLADCLRQECIPYNVKVAVVFAGNFESEGYEIENRTKPQITKQIEGASPVISADECARLIAKQLNNGQEMITTDFIGFFLSSSMLSFSPRINYFAQVLFAFVLAIIGPIVEASARRNIKKYYEKKIFTADKKLPLEEDRSEQL